MMKTGQSLLFVSRADIKSENNNLFDLFHFFLHTKSHKTQTIDLPVPFCKKRKETRRSRISFILSFFCFSSRKADNKKFSLWKSSAQWREGVNGLRQCSEIPLNRAQPSQCVMVSWSLLVLFEHPQWKLLHLLLPRRSDLTSRVCATAWIEEILKRWSAKIQSAHVLFFFRMIAAQRKPQFVLTRSFLWSYKKTFVCWELLIYFLFSFTLIPLLLCSNKHFQIVEQTSHYCNCAFWCNWLWNKSKVLALIERGVQTEKWIVLQPVTSSSSFSVTVEQKRVLVVCVPKHKTKSKMHAIHK